MAKVAVIVGARAGVGLATVDEFARDRYYVALLSRDSGRLDRAAASIEKLGVRALSSPTDVVDAATPQPLKEDRSVY